MQSTEASAQVDLPSLAPNAGFSFNRLVCFLGHVDKDCCFSQWPKQFIQGRSRPVWHPARCAAMLIIYNSTTLRSRILFLLQRVQVHT